MAGSIKTGEVVRTLPRMPDVLVARPQARRYLDRWAAVTVVRGLQGYGKTTLVAGWLQDQPAAVRSVWVSARTTGSDPDLFAGHLLGELRQAVPDFDNPLGSSAESRGCTADKALEAISTTLRNIPEWERIVMVVDDAQWLRDESFLNRIMAVIARHRHLHLVLCSRGTHPLERLFAGAVDTVTVPARELLLTAPQVCELAERGQIPLSAEQAEQLHAELGGWAAAVWLVLREVRDAEPHLPLARAQHYLRETVLPAIGDKTVLAEIMRFSLAERLTHRLIRDLAGDCDYDPDTLVRLIESPGLAERKYQADDIELVFPSFIRASLRELYAGGQPDDAAMMHRRLAHWYGTHKGRGHAAFALCHAIAGRDWERAHYIWTHHSIDMLLEHPHAPLESLCAVPAGVVTVHPWMRLAQAISAVGVGDDNADGRMAVLRAYAEASRRAPAEGVARLALPDALDVGTGAMLAHRFEGNLADADALGGHIQQRAEALIADGADAGDRLPWFHLQRGLTHSLRADHHEAATHYQLAWQHRRQATPRVAAIAAGNLALTHSLTAHPAAAEHWLTRCRSTTADQAGGQFATETGALLARGMLALDRLDGESCRATLDELGNEPGTSELWAYVVYLSGQHGLHYDDPATSLAVLDTAQDALPPVIANTEAARLLLARCRADLLLASGKGHHAQHVLANHSSEQIPTLAVPLARLHLLAGHPSEAFHVATNLVWSPTTDNRSRQELLLINALAAHRMGEPSTSARLARQALGLYRHTRTLAAFTVLHDDDLDLLLETAAGTAEYQEIAAIREQRRPYPSSITLIALTAREQLLARALGTTASRQQIADQLYVSLNTIRAQLLTLYRKLGVANREQALTQLACLGLTINAPHTQVLPTPDRQLHRHPQIHDPVSTHAAESPA